MYPQAGRLLHGVVFFYDVLYPQAGRLLHGVFFLRCVIPASGTLAAWGVF